MMWKLLLVRPLATHNIIQLFLKLAMERLQSQPFHKQLRRWQTISIHQRLTTNLEGLYLLCVQLGISVLLMDDPHVLLACLLASLLCLYTLFPTTWQPWFFYFYLFLKRSATGLQCPHCHRQTVTTTRDVIGVGTVIAILVVTILFWPLFWVPLCIPSCKRTNHFCGHTECRKKVGVTPVCA